MLLNTFWEATGAILVWFFIVIPIMMLWGFALVDLFRRSDIRWRKVVWLLAIIFVPILGSLAYLFFRAFALTTSVEGYSDITTFDDVDQPQVRPY